MKTPSITPINYFFLGACLVVTVGLGIDCMWKYLANECVSHIAYKKFNHDHPENIYPSITFCIQMPLLEHDLKKYGDDLNSTSYFEFLTGHAWDDRMTNIDYDEVTVSLKDHLNGIAIQTHGREYFFYDAERQIGDPAWWAPNFYPSRRSASFKCFTVDVPFIENKLVRFLEIDIRKSFFTQTLNVLTKSKMVFFFHYPGQRLLSYYSITFISLDHIRNQSNLVMTFTIKDVESVKRRNKRNDRCIENWRHYDDEIWYSIMSKVGCRPPQWKYSNLFLNLPLCTLPEEMKHFMGQPTAAEMDRFPLPCKVIQSLDYLYTEKNLQKTFLSGKKYLYQL